jgi:SAM-dependent methyltransferase
MAVEIGPLNPRVFGAFLRERGWRYVAVDGSRRGNVADPRAVGFVDLVADVRELGPIATGSADLVLIQHVIEEVEDYDRALAEIARVLAPRGTALLEIPFDPERERSEPHPPDVFGNVWSFGRDLLDVVRTHLGSVQLQPYSEGSAAGRLLVCRHAHHNPVAIENALPGDADWWGEHCSPGEIEGYASGCSVRPGDRLELHVSTNPPQRYRIAVYRLGWYGGAGARTITVHPAPRSDVQGLAREQPLISPGPKVDAAGWPITDVIAVDEHWTTGVYVASLTLTTGEGAGRSSFVPFVVRPPLGAVADVLVQQPVVAAQAYNNFGGKSLQTNNSTDGVAAASVTFDRPFAAWTAANLNALWPFVWDYQLVRYLEREGIDVSYTTDVDTHIEPWSVLGHRVLMTCGHGKYWTREIRDAFDTARDEGVSIACMGADTCYWQIRLEDNSRTLVEYHQQARDSEPDGALETERFRDLNPPRPECLLFGIQHQDGLAAKGQPPRDYQLTEECANHAWLDHTGFEHPATLRRLVGYESDAIQSGFEPPDATVFFRYDGPEPPPAETVAHRAPSGALVFAAGSLQFAWGLDDWGHQGHADERLKQFVRNVLADLIA